MAAANVATSALLVALHQAPTPKHPNLAPLPSADPAPPPPSSQALLIPTTSHSAYTVPDADPGTSLPPATVVHNRRMTHWRSDPYQTMEVTATSLVITRRKDTETGSAPAAFGARICGWTGGPHGRVYGSRRASIGVQRVNGVDGGMYR